MKYPHEERWIGESNTRSPPARSQKLKETAHTPTEIWLTHPLDGKASLDELGARQPEIQAPVNDVPKHTR
jgi:hypothetical protein